MHRSKLGQILIDCRENDLDGALAFWAGALGLEPSPDDGAEDRYRELRGPDGDAHVLLQRCEWPSAYHLDIEADDIDAEVRRLEALGATRVRKGESWWVMRAPTGHDFCVVRPQSKSFADTANTWGLRSTP